MKKYIKNSHNISRRYTNNLVEELKSYLGIGYYSNDNLKQQSWGPCNFVLTFSPYRRTDKDVVESYKARLKELGAKYITYRYGDLWFYLDTTKIEDKLRQQQEANDAEYYSALDAFDVSQYAPDDAVLKKLADYRARASKVNVKAIKSVDKLLTYYYGAKILG